LDISFFIDPDICRAETLPSEFYSRDDVFEAMKVSVFKRSWHWIGPGNKLTSRDQPLYPFFLLPDFLDEPLLLSLQEDGKINLLANVCTHRGNILVTKPCKARQLVCGYHGRRFSLDGAFHSMPEFANALDFPRVCDNLTTYSHTSWEGHLFASLGDAFDLTAFLNILKERVGFMPVSQFKSQPKTDSVFEVNAHWALYCDNYLEGFHIPFVHPSLNKIIDFDQYKTVLFEFGSLQIGYARNAEDAFDFPENHIDFGSRVAAYYFWLFPNLMLNFYPWGLSVNRVEPITKNKTRVRFESYVFDPSKMHGGAGAQLDSVEKEDEDIVASVQKGIVSGGYSTGRFSPTQERGVHYFHLLLSRFLKSRDKTL
jgi:choline monooxygenase